MQGLERRDASLACFYASPRQIIACHGHGRFTVRAPGPIVGAIEEGIKCPSDHDGEKQA
jgi:hypothetical protein